MQIGVRGYDALKTVDDGEPLRARHGCAGHEIFRDDDGNLVQNAVGDAWAALTRRFPEPAAQDSRS